MKNVNVSELVGKTLKSINGGVGDDSITFTTTEGEAYYMYHAQDCCENVCVEDICGDLKDLIDTPILQAEESNSGDTPDTLPSWHDSSYTWTFYRFATMKGSVVIRWFGSSNGYYSESVDFVKLEN